MGRGGLFLGRGNSRYKGPEAGGSLVCLREMWLGLSKPERRGGIEDGAPGREAMVRHLEPGGDHRRVWALLMEMEELSVSSEIPFFKNGEDVGQPSVTSQHKG